MPHTEDETDPEALQAQINMSMSFAHHLVTSWIPAGQMARLYTNAPDVDHTLREDLRRPSRLGVGAAAPPAASAGRDASKLRHRLIKTSQKTKRSPELPFSPDLDSGDDEEKGVPRKRMKRVDPFMYGNKRSKVHKCEREAAQKAEPSPSIKKKLSINAAPVISRTTQHQSSSTDPPKTGRRGTDLGDHVPTLPFGSQHHPTDLGIRVLKDAEMCSTDTITSLLNLEGPLDERTGNSDNPNVSKKQRRRRKKKKPRGDAGTPSTKHPS